MSNEQQAIETVKNLLLPGTAVPGESDVSLQIASLAATILVVQSIDRLTLTLQPLAALATEIAPLIAQAKADLSNERKAAKTRTV